MTTKLKTSSAQNYTTFDANKKTRQTSSSHSKQPKSSIFNKAVLVKYTNIWDMQCNNNPFKHYNYNVN